MEKNEKNTVTLAADLVESLSPANYQTISTIALVHWNNILNHCALENLSASDTLLVAHLLKALALTHFENEKNEFYQAVGQDYETAFQDSIAFLTERQKNNKNKQ